MVSPGCSSQRCPPPTPTFTFTFVILKWNFIPIKELGLALLQKKKSFCFVCVVGSRDLGPITALSPGGPGPRAGWRHSQGEEGQEAATSTGEAQLPGSASTTMRLGSHQATPLSTPTGHPDSSSSSGLQPGGRELRPRSPGRAQPWASSQPQPRVPELGAPERRGLPGRRPHHHRLPGAG